jgi:SAM-dependent methyltransferase
VKYTRWPPVRWVSMGSLRRLTPISGDWGFSRGLPVDRYYIERFLAGTAKDIQGHVLEMGSPDYTLQFGAGRVTDSDVLHKEEGNDRATVVDDLTAGNELADHTYDCIICTQTLQFVYDVRSAIATLHRTLKPGGVLLVTVPTIAQISRPDMDRWGEYWRFTSLSARLLFEEVFPVSNVAVHAYGNVLAATAFLYGLAREELKPEELDHFDPDYEFLVTVRAVKEGSDG